MTRGPLLHADADAFFASVAMRGRPDLAVVPMAVVAHVFVASANYPARARGVKSGTLVTEALRQCPGLHLIKVSREQVEEVGDALFDLFADIADAVEPGSIEEAFLDVGARDENDAVAAAQELRRRAARELGIPVSVGIGRTKLMAKLASRAAKPDGVHIIAGEREAELRRTLPVDQVWGVGPRTVERLRLIGVTSLAQIDAVTADELRRVCGTTMARLLGRIRNGTDDATVRPVEDRTALSTEGSIAGYNRPDLTPAALAAACVARVCRRAERAGLVATGIQLTLRPAGEGSPISLRRHRITATADTREWTRIAQELLDGIVVPPLTTVSVTLTGLLPPEQASIALF